MSGAAVLFQVTRVETIEFTRRVQLVWWDANAGVSLKNNFIICSERCSLADLDCLFQGEQILSKCQCAECTSLSPKLIFSPCLSQASEDVRLSFASIPF